MKKVLTAVTLLAIGTLMLNAQQKAQPNAQANAQSKAQPNGPGPEEVKALQEIVNAKTLETRVAAVDSFVKDFPKSNYLSVVLSMAADAYEASGNATKAIIYYQQALAANPKDYSAMLMLAAETARTTREFDLDKEEKLAKAEKYAKDGMALIGTAEKPNPQITDPQWEAMKKDDMARGHEAMGMIALARKKYDDAASAFKLATETSPEPQPATMLRLASAYTDAGKPTEAIATLDKVLATPNLPDQLKKVAEAQKARAEKAKTAKQ